MAFAENLKALRKKHNLTQVKLAAELGVTKRSIVNYEAGRSYPSVDTVARLEELYNVRMDLLIDESEEFVAQAQALYGIRGKRGSEQLVADVCGLFAGGELSDGDMDAAMKSLQEAYWIAKEKNKKYTPKKFRK